MAKKKTLDELFERLDQTLDYGEYAAIERRDKRLADDIANLVGAGATPRQIAVHITDSRPHLWPAAQQIFAAARYLKSQETE